METIIDFFASWGYGGMFLSALLAGSIIPFSSELVFAMMISGGKAPLLVLIAASLGNFLGSMSCYWVGMLGKREWIHRWLGVSEEKLDKAARFLQGRGAWMGFFTFLPYIGEATAVTLGIMRARQSIVALSMLIGKVVRYGTILLITLGVISL